MENTIIPTNKIKIDLKLDEKKTGCPSKCDNNNTNIFQIKPNVIEKRIENYLKVWSELAQNGNDIDTLLVNPNLSIKNIKGLDYHVNNTKSKLKLLAEQVIKNSTDQKNSSFTDDHNMSKSLKKNSSGDGHGTDKINNNNVSENDIVEKSSVKVDENIGKLTDEDILTLKKQLGKRTIELSEILPRYKFLEENFNNFLLIKTDYLLLKQQKEIESQPAKLKLEKNELIHKIDNFTQISKKGFSWINITNKIQLDEFYHNRTKFTQTWDSVVICEKCSKTHQMLENPNTQNLIQINSGCASCISNSELKLLKENFKLIKEMIVDREKDYENRNEIAQILDLVNLNNNHRSRIMELEKKLNLTTKYANILQKVMLKIPTSEMKKLTLQEQKWVDDIKQKLVKNSDTNISIKTDICRDGKINN